MDAIQERRNFEQEKYEYMYNGGDPSYNLYGHYNHAKELYGFLEKINIKSVCDIGCGGGHFCNWIRSRVNKVIGVDFASNPSGDNITWIKAQATSIPLEASCVEFVTAFDMLEHLLTEDVDIALKEFRRLATRGFIFSISYFPSGLTLNGDNMHPTIRSEEWWINKISKYGTIYKYGEYLICTFNFDNEIHETALSDVFEAAICLHKEGKTKEAKKLYKNILLADPNHPQVLNLLGILDLANGNYSEATYWLEKTSQIAPDYECLRDLGNAYLNSNMPEEAIQALKKALLYQPDCLECYNSIAMANFKLKNYNEAINTYLHILTKNESVDIYNNLGIAFKDNNQLEFAIEAFNKAIKLNKSFQEAYLNLGDSYKQTGNYEEAQECLRRAINLSEKKNSPYVFLADIHLKFKDIPAALNSIDKHLSILPEDYKVMVKKAEISLGNCNTDEAVHTLNKALLGNFNDEKAHYILGKAYLIKGNKDFAILEMEKAIIINCEYNEAISELKNLLDENIINFFNKRLINSSNIVDKFSYLSVLNNLKNRDKEDDTWIILKSGQNLNKYKEQLSELLSKYHSIGIDDIPVQLQECEYWLVQDKNIDINDVIDNYNGQKIIMSADISDNLLEHHSDIVNAVENASTVYSRIKLKPYYIYKETKNLQKTFNSYLLNEPIFSAINYALIKGAKKIILTENIDISKFDNISFSILDK